MGAEVIKSLVPFGIAGLAIVAVVTVVIAVRNPQSTGSWLLALAMVIIAGIFIVERLWPPPDAYWFDAGFRADWGGRDLAYTSGLRPKYTSFRKQDLCDGDRLGNVVTCWDNRPALNSRDPGVQDNDVQDSDTIWCAYKDRSIKVSTKPDGLATPGRVYVCAQNVPRKVELP
jgi:hypothetical protein